MVSIALPSFLQFMSHACGLIELKYTTGRRKGRGGESASFALRFRYSTTGVRMAALVSLPRETCDSGCDSFENRAIRTARVVIGNGGSPMFFEIRYLRQSSECGAKCFFIAFRILRKQTSPSLGKKWGVSGKFEKAGEILGGTRTIPVVREAIRAVSKASDRNGNPIRTFKGCVNPRGASDD